MQTVASTLALFGGPPVRDRLLPYGRQTIDEDDIAAVVAVLRSEWLTTGPAVAAFEEAVAARVGARFAVAFSSGTAALHAAAFAAGLGPGDEAITTPLTFSATANCVLYQGATPRFADIRPLDLTLDPDRVAAAITPRTRAILPMDYAGHPADLDALRALAQRHGLLIIEDAAHALGAVSRGRPVGSLADITIFSFHPVKHVAAGEGGMAVTNDPALASRLRRFRTHGIVYGVDEREPWRYDLVDLGFNYRLADLNCALGLSQLKKLDANLARRRAIAAAYREAFAGLPWLTLPRELPGMQSAWHLYPIRLNLDTLRAGRAEIFRALRAEGIGVQVHYLPVHLLRLYRERFGYRPGAFPLAEAAYERLISLPLFPGMSDGDVADVIAAVTKVLRAYGR
ncbi:MAG: UDP-4-amino-4,6-dideoxy-N-acetyl-beta-L-altrosamine transaminase [Chloroflexota bacterium]|nr:UDP-4-amino-4,6-dideoxy-N-acetyl-beta-L-altrosamine transaminase [Dehalococcoidia bacterium]MDW8254593.1 UDP-4-amino-4,6-dideoxy-N-acetyl-beta-L-altrosamine transaminase [Chloroflexota bacterium]